MKLLKKALIFLLNIIYPQCCNICGKRVESILCEDCKRRLYQSLDVKIISKVSKEYYFDKLIYFFKYKDYIRNLILDYKFNDKSYLFKTFSEIIIKNKKICRILQSYDIIIPVPIHKNRKKERGYNQSELISLKIVNELINVKIENKVIIKQINNKKQSSLSKDERRRNVKDVYKIINNKKIKDKKIILFDDIFTTGNTTNEISKILKQNGAKEILVLVIAKD